MQREIEPINTPQNQRVSELDWLRVLLILGVFLHHVLMPFNGDGWHVTNSTASKLLDDLMVYFEQFRLPILFFIAGAGSSLLIKRLKVSGFVKDKFFRLLIPLAVGTVLVVPIQLFYEKFDHYTAEQTYWTGVLQAYGDSILAGKTNHLWFLDFLIAFMMLYALVAYLIQVAKPKKRNSSKQTSLFSQITIWPFAILLTIGSVIIGIRLVTKVYFPSQDHELENLSVSLFYLCFFISGAVLIQVNSLWNAFSRIRYKSLMGLILTSLLFYGYYFSGEIFADWHINLRWQVWWGLSAALAWFALLTLVGFAQVLLKQTPMWLKNTNRLIFPFYVLHQSVIVILAFYIVALDWSLPSKAILVFMLSLVITYALCVFVVDKNKVTRFLFGVRKT